jgi:hypothetical protein
VALREELLMMEQADQQLRKSLSSPPSETELARLRELDARHTSRLKQLCQEHGWPGFSLVGRDGACAAWLLAQHADADVEFQAQCLQLMRAAMVKGEASRKDGAYLEDRVRINRGQPQLYGTQFRRKADGQGEPYPIEDPGRIDQRRRSVGLEPLADYERELKTIFRGTER